MIQQRRILMKILAPPLLRPPRLSPSQSLINNRLHKPVHNLPWSLDTIAPKLNQPPTRAVSRPQTREDLASDKGSDETVRGVLIRKRCRAGWEGGGRVREAGRERADVCPAEEFGGRVEGETGNEVLQDGVG